MKPVGFIATGVLLLLFGAVAPTYAQQDQHEQDAKPDKQEQKAKPEKKQEAKPAKQEQQHQAKGQEEQQQKQQQQEAKSAKKEQQHQAKGQQEQRQEANRPSKQEQHGQKGEQRAVWQEHRAQNWKSEHRDWQQRGGYNGYRIPEDRYRGYFGPDHYFRIYSYPLVVVGGYPRFQYGGFWISFVDPWPEYWAEDWYDNDDVYVEYSGDGYYMFNRRYPGDQIAISISVD